MAGKKRAMLDYCFILHALIQLSQRPQDPQGCASDQQKCVDSIVKALKSITFRFKRDFLQNFKVKNTAVNLLPQEGNQPSEEVEPQRLQTRPQGHVT